MLDFGKIYNITMKQAKSTSFYLHLATFLLTIYNQITTKFWPKLQSTKKVTPPPFNLSMISQNLSVKQIDFEKSTNQPECVQTYGQLPVFMSRFLNGKHYNLKDYI